MSVIVFGPTGSIASATALSAQHHGAKVWLAMRDISKAIPGLSAEDEKNGGFERVQADLTKPETVAAAVRKANAKRAFFYLAFGTSDRMKGVVEALKTSGIESPVFLSSYTVDGELSEVAPTELISFVHAQVEMTLDEVYGPENYVAIRPGGFATNLLNFKTGINAGEVRLFGPNFTYDCITPIDMGRVSGTILAKGLKNDQRKVYLYGPKVLPQKEAVETVARVLGKEVKIVEVDEKEGREQLAALGTPAPLVEYYVKKLNASADDHSFDRTRYEEGVANVELYTGQPSTGFADWIAANKELFA